MEALDGRLVEGHCLNHGLRAVGLLGGFDWKGARDFT